MNFIVDSTIARLVTSVKFKWPYSNSLDSSFEKRRIISTLIDRLETRSRRYLRCVAKRGQYRRKCPLTSISVRHRHDELEKLKLYLNLSQRKSLDSTRSRVRSFVSMISWMLKN